MKYLVTYQLPHEGLDAWMKIPEAERKDKELEMQEAWNAWTREHAPVIRESGGVGKPKRITKDGIEDTRNDLMLYSFVEAASLDEAAALFKDHPHVSVIPGAWIEVMEVNENVT